MPCIIIESLRCTEKKISEENNFGVFFVPVKHKISPILNDCDVQLEVYKLSSQIYTKKKFNYIFNDFLRTKSLFCKNGYIFFAKPGKFPIEIYNKQIIHSNLCTFPQL